MEEVFFERSALPNQGQAFQDFLRSYPLYLDTLVVDHIREQEYPHLNERSQVCLDYMGVGLFTFSQQASNSPSAALGLAYISANLTTHALYTAEETEILVRRRVLRYMNIDENEYAIVFTANKLSAFKLLGESYPFHVSSKLLLGYDHCCESQDALIECAKSKGATVMSANLTWPSLKLDKADVKKKLHLKRKVVKSKGWGFHSAHGGTAGRDFSSNQPIPLGAQGMMAYPVASCGSGAKNSLQWIREAGQNGWHVLLDVSGLGAKAMDTLGLNLFHPDFIVGSFYKVFGSDPTGFGCLVIKISVIRSLGDSSRARAIGMVRIVSTAGGFGTGSWDPSHSSSSSSSSIESHQQQQHLSTRTTMLTREKDVLNARFEERFITGGSQLNQSHKKINAMSPVGLPKPNPALRTEGVQEMLYVESKMQEEDVEISKEWWVRSQSSSSSMDHHSKDSLDHNKRASPSSLDNCHQSSVRNEVAIPPVALKSSSSHRRRYSDTPQGINSGQEKGKQQDTTPRLERAKEGMLGLRYLQIPKQGWDHKGMSVDEESFLSRDFGKKSPLMLTLPKGFDSPSNRTPPLSKHEMYQEFLMGSLPETPSSVSAPCSPCYPRPHDICVNNSMTPDSQDRNPSRMIVCGGLDVADKIGLTRINFRLRALVNWLICSLRKLRHSTPGHPHVVVIYGPLCQSDRSPTFTFNIAGPDGHLLDPALVQRLADRSSISLGTSILQGSFTLEVDETSRGISKPKKGEKSRDCKTAFKGGSGMSSPRAVDLARQKWNCKEDTLHAGQFSVVCASLCFLSSFTDVYRLLEFVALFLDADFVHKELFHYQALNQQTILM